MPMTPKEIVKLLQANGFVYVSSTGSHREYRNPQTGKTGDVPVHAKGFKPGTGKSILKMAGLK